MNYFESLKAYLKSIDAEYIGTETLKFIYNSKLNLILVYCVDKAMNLCRINYLCTIQDDDLIRYESNEYNYSMYLFYRQEIYNYLILIKDINLILENIK